MAKFRFSYEVLLDQRRRVEDERQRDLAQLIRSRMIFHDQLRRMQDNITESKHNLGSGLVGRVDLSRIATVASYTQTLTRRGHEFVHKLAQLEHEISTARAKFIAATHERKALELLRDKQHALWRRTQGQRETAELDEIATQSFVRAQLAERHAPRKRVIGGVH